MSNPTLRKQQAQVNAELIGKRARCVRSSERFTVLDEAVRLGERMSDLLYDIEREPVS